MNGKPESIFAKRMADSLRSMEDDTARRERDAAVVAMMALRRTFMNDGGRRITCSMVLEVLKEEFGENVGGDGLRMMEQRARERLGDRKSRLSLPDAFEQAAGLVDGN